MARADATAGRTERAVLDLAEAVLLAGRGGETFAAVASDIDARGTKIKLRDLPVVLRVDGAGPASGQPLTVKLAKADVGRRMVTFELVAERS